MTNPLTALAAHPVPAYCGNLIKTPPQWKACWDAGWSQSTTGAANAGATAGHYGHYAAPWVIGALIVLAVIWLMTRKRSGSPATS